MCGTMSSRNRDASKGRGLGVAVPAEPALTRAREPEPGLAGGPRLGLPSFLRNGMRLMTRTVGGVAWAKWPSLHDHLSRHLRVDGAKVAVNAGLGEGEAVSVGAVERLGVERTVDRAHRVGDVVVVGPGHGRASGDGHRLRPESEVVDR